MDGISPSITLSASLRALVVARAWRRALWRRLALLGLSALIGIPLGSARRCAGRVHERNAGVGGPMISA